MGKFFLRIPSSILTSDKEPPLDRGGGAERLRRRVMAAYVATPSHEKTCPSVAPLGTSLMYFTYTIFQRTFIKYIFALFHTRALLRARCTCIARNISHCQRSHPHQQIRQPSGINFQDSFVHLASARIALFGSSTFKRSRH